MKWNRITRRELKEGKDLIDKQGDQDYGNQAWEDLDLKIYNFIHKCNDNGKRIKKSTYKKLIKKSKYVDHYCYSSENDGLELELMEIGEKVLLVFKYFEDNPGWGVLEDIAEGYSEQDGCYIIEYYVMEVISDLEDMMETLEELAMA